MNLNRTAMDVRSPWQLGELSNESHAHREEEGPYGIRPLSLEERSYWIWKGISDW